MAVIPDRIRNFQADIRQCSKTVEREISLAKAQADHQDQQLQLKEREAASQGRKAWNSFMTKSGKESDEFREWRIQVNERKAKKRRQRLLNSLSTYNHVTAFKLERRKRHGSTNQWLASSPEFDRWKKDIGLPVLWCSGKIGSGKTVLMTSVIDHLFVSRENHGMGVAFFFCRFDEAISLKAETILRSIIRQLLEATALPDAVESSLDKLSQNSSFDVSDLQNLLQESIASSQPYYIVIDALDECEKSERKLVFNILRSWITSHPTKVKLCLAGREGLHEELRKCFPSLQHLSLGSLEASSDISTYIKDALAEKLENDDLVVGNRMLIQQIEDALIKGADGMFLWVAFVLDDVCCQHSDEAIRQILFHLPSNLSEVFNRALLGILSKGNPKIAKQVFRWIAAVKRPITLDELQEALAIEPAQPHSMPERRLNNISQVTMWCKNLVMLDEEENTLHFAHHSVQQYLLDEPTDKRLDGFHFLLHDADHDVGEICVTYLNFNDFETQLIRHPERQAAITPGAILSSMVGARSESRATKYILRTFMPQRQQSTKKVDVLHGLANYKGIQDEQPAQSFLPYVSENWLFHTSRFEVAKSTTWGKWTKLVTDEKSLGQKPWSHEEFVKRDDRVAEYICSHNHCALLRLIMVNDQQLRPNIPWKWTRTFHTQHDLWAILKYYLSLLHAAAFGELQVVERLLTAGVNVEYVHDASEHFHATPPKAAAEGGHLEIVERLLKAGANVNAADSGLEARNALQAAAEWGHLEVVERLLKAGAEVNAAAVGDRGRTALQAAAEGGHLEVVERLLKAGAEVNAAAVDFDGRTALQAAAEGGHLEVVERLLKAGAEVNAAAVDFDGRTALQAAAEDGHLEVVKRLLAAGANVNAAAAKRHGRTALQAAARSGHLQVVEYLLGAGADVNAPASKYGLTALQAAADGEFPEVVSRLKAAGARK